MINVLMYPAIHAMETFQSGILRVIQAYHRYGKDFDINYIDCDIDYTSMYDVLAVHAGSINKHQPDKPLVAHNHGLYWTGNYDAESWEWNANRSVIDSLRNAHAITVPSEWVADVLRRDMHISPFVIPHGIEWQEWQHDIENEGYVLFNKNRDKDVCSPHAVSILAHKFSDVPFVTTVAPDNITGNVTVVGLMPHDRMRRVIQGAAVYLSTTQETFCIGALEAMASGIPVLGWRSGNLPNLVTHGADGYIAAEGNWEELAYGLNYCLTNRKVLGENAKTNVKRFNWDKAMPLVYAAYQAAIKEHAWENTAVVVDISKESADNEQ